VFLGAAPQFFHPQFLATALLAENYRFQRPCGIPDHWRCQLLNGKLQNASLNLTQASSRITFDGIRASLDFFNARRKMSISLFTGDRSA